MNTEILETLIALALSRGAHRESLCVGLDAHALLTGKPLDGVFVDRQLAALYPQFVPRPTADELELREAAIGKERPISIWHRGDQLAYFRATDEERSAWNVYAQFSANEFDNDPRRDSYDSTAVFAGYDRDGNVTSWCPPLYFPEWLAARK